MRILAQTWKKLFAIALLAGLLYVADPVELWKSLEQLTLPMVAYLAVLSVLLIYLSALKWKLFLEAFDATASTLRLFNLYLVGYFVNLLVPSYVGGDVVRSWYIGKKVGQHKALAATILERYTGLVAMIVLALVLMWRVDNITLQVRLLVLAVSAGAVFVTLAALSPRIVVLLGRFGKLQLVAKHVQKVQEGFRLAKSNKALLAKSMVLSFAFHCCTVVNVLAAAHAVGWTTVPAWELFIVLPLILLIGAIPITPSGLGLQEGAFYYFLHQLGATPAQALGVAVVLRAKSYALALVGSLVWLKIRRETGVETIGEATGAGQVSAGRAG